MPVGQVLQARSNIEHKRRIAARASYYESLSHKQKRNEYYASQPDIKQVNKTLAIIREKARLSHLRRRKNLPRVNYSLRDNRSSQPKSLHRFIDCCGYIVLIICLIILSWLCVEILLHYHPYLEVILIG
jgi:hypothetical protein